MPYHFDLFIVNDRRLIHSFSDSDSPFISGHDFITLNLFLAHIKRPHITIKTRQLSKLDHTTLQTELANKLEFLFSDPRAYNTIDTIESHITTALETTFDDLVPIRTITITHKMKPWVTPAILETMKDRDHAFKRASQSHCPLDIEENRHLRSSVSNYLDTAKSKYLEARLTKAKSSKERWR